MDTILNEVVMFNSGSMTSASWRAGSRGPFCRTAHANKASCYLVTTKVPERGSVVDAPPATLGPVDVL